MKKVLTVSMSLAGMVIIAGVLVHAVSTTFVITPTSMVFSSENINGVMQDSAPGFGTGSFASNGVAKTDMYFAPEALFGREINLGEVASISYWTKKGTTHTQDIVDWFLNIYTKPYGGQVGSAGWYGDRIGAEPYFSINLNDPGSTWNQWSTDTGDNQLRFFESTHGAPGATFGSYTDPDWATLLASNSDWQLLRCWIHRPSRRRQDWAHRRRGGEPQLRALPPAR